MTVVPTEQLIDAMGGLKIFTRVWRPQVAPRAVVAICHGVNSHSGQYFWAAEQLVAGGYAVYALDLRGRGRSEGERYHVDSISEYVSDLHGLITLAKSKEPGLPVFLMGHSAGGVTSCNYVLDHPTEVVGLICESFAYKVPAPAIALQIIKGVSHFAPDAPVLKLHNEDFSRDPVVVQSMNEDLLIHDEAQPSITVAALVRADERLKKEFPLITLPVFILHGTADKATKPAGSQEFFDHAGSADKTLKFYEGHFHDLLNDYGKEEVMGDIIAWIDKRV